MRIEKITVNNFRQYYGINEIDLSTENDKNIILIGGQNGFGKTNLLLALVWCLYGDDIEKIDDNIKKEIRKEKNFRQFIKQTLNWDAEKEGKTSFFVEIELNGVELPEFNNITEKSSYQCIIKREFDANTLEDNLNISVPNSNIDFLSNEEEKIDFINDYIVPIEAAKFVFFDAEKIANLAELNTKEEGEFMNDALGKVLGLDVYEELVKDLDIYSKNLKKEGATENIKEQIANAENGIALNESKIEETDDQIAEIEKEINNLNIKLKEYDDFLNKHYKTTSKNYNREELIQNKENLQKKLNQYEKKFNEISEILPLAIAAGTLEETYNHLSKQEKQKTEEEYNQRFKEKFEIFLENLFNKEPHEDSMPFKAKSFYYNKAKELYEQIFIDTKTYNELPFEHDLSNADKELIKKAYNIIVQQSKETFQETFEGYNKTKNEIQEIESSIRKIDTDLQDETILEYSTERKELQRKIYDLIERKGGLENYKNNLKKDINKLKQKLEMFSNKVETRDKLKSKLDKTQNYIKTINEFIDKVKKTKENSLSQSIYDELKRIMHKLTSYNQFIEEVKVQALPENGGLKVDLYDSEGNIVPKERLSQGEKQLYISSLIKAIMKEAIRDFPIFIDTPLGRLDHEHINNILHYYYPNLANQVVILATSNEIPPSRYKMIENNVSKAYLLVNKENNTSIKQGYFQAYEN